MLNHSAKSCSCCPLSRRCFLGTAVASLAAPAVFAATDSGGAPEAKNAYIDLADFRPRPSIQVRVAVVRKSPPYWLGWPGTTSEIQRVGEGYI